MYKDTAPRLRNFLEEELGYRLSVDISNGIYKGDLDTDEDIALIVESIETWLCIQAEIRLRSPNCNPIIFKFIEKMIMRLLLHARSWDASERIAVVMRARGHAI